jgi:hypothetical protein
MTLDEVFGTHNLHLPKLRAALQARFDENVSTARDDDNVKAA